LQRGLCIGLREMRFEVRAAHFRVQPSDRSEVLRRSDSVDSLVVKRAVERQFCRDQSLTQLAGYLLHSREDRLRFGALLRGKFRGIRELE